MRLHSSCAIGLAALAACAPTRRRAPESGPAAAPAAQLARAIEAAGGRAALGAARALRWEGRATVHAGGRTVGIRGTWAIQPPDSAVVATYDTTRGPATMRRLIVAGPRGWLEQQGAFTPMPPALLATERDEFYLYDVLRLVRLAGPDTELVALAGDSTGATADAAAASGFEARTAGRPPVAVHLDDAGRVRRLRLRITDARTGARVWQELRLSGTVRAGGIRWPREIRITMDGAPYFDLTIDRLAVESQLVEPYLAGPRGG